MLAFLNLGTAPTSVSPVNYIDLINSLNPSGASFTGEYGGALKGESGLRSGYADYVANVLGRMQHNQIS